MAASAVPSDTPVHILLVDDEPANLLALEAILGDLGHDLVRARSGAEALARLGEHSFAVVLLDVQMQGLDGFETARRIRSQEASRHTPIIFLTGHDENRERVEEAYALGAVDYLVKPLMPVVLRAKVMGFVELFRKTEQLRRVEREQFERKLADENARFRALTEYSSDAVVLLDAGCTVLYTSPSTRRVLGYEPNEFVGHNGFEFVHPQDLACVQQRLGDLVHNPELPVQVEARVRHKDGSWRWMDCVGTNLMRQPAVGAIVVNFRDITERQEAAAALRESERRFSGFMQHLTGLAWIKDLHGRYVFANDAAMRIFARTLDELYGLADGEIFDAATAAQFTENDRQALAGTGVQVVETLKHPDGLLHHSLVTKFPIPGSDGRPAFIGGMAIDITDRIEAEHKLKEADRRKDEFLAMLAHELRNPLAPIRNALYMLRLPETAAETAQEALAMVERQVHNMVRLVDDLLDVSRITRGKIQLRTETVELAAVLQRAVDATRPLVEANRHTLTLTLTPKPTRVEADPTRLEQVFANLLNNAAKYTERGGTIAVSTARDGRDVVVRVRDSGFGIPPTMLPRIFDLFAQGDRTLDRAQGGLGIGLTLVKTLVEMHGGSVTADSAGPGQGSEFTVRLPACADGPTRSDTVPTETPAVATGDPTGLQVLVVEDNKDAADSLAMLMQVWGHDVRTARDGLSGLKAARSYRPHVVFLDIGLPGLDGYEVARRLREEFGMDLRLVAMTGYGQEDDRRRAGEAGFDAHLVKPADPDLLQRLLAACAAAR